MADKNGFSEVIAEILIQMDRQQETQTAILERLDRNEAGFNAFANAALDHLSGIRTGLQGMRSISDEHEERLPRLEDSMRRAS
ncbi:hypothetical protein [Hymenobacter sp. BT190]|uniref:hypothetical protein n=1 Tax=Hymenobacter sp. BT190 TaxID=2763505 RepID=UPI0016519528|nr:hypothetical protein [Hymenobacter sp. BT190]MBC6700011.1 hypothetical protein [Hymenobacter sp. BT190]